MMHRSRSVWNGAIPREMCCRRTSARGEVEAVSAVKCGLHAHMEATDRAVAGCWLPCAARTRCVFTSVHGDSTGPRGLPQRLAVRRKCAVPLLVRAPGAESAVGGVSSRLSCRSSIFRDDARWHGADACAGSRGRRPEDFDAQRGPLRASATGRGAGANRTASSCWRRRFPGSTLISSGTRGGSQLRMIRTGRARERCSAGSLAGCFMETRRPVASPKHSLLHRAFSV